MKNKDIQLVKFNCPSFKKNKNDICHLGLFGTMLRYYPLFDFQDNKNIKHVITTDIDIPSVHNILLYKKIYDFLTKNYPLIRVHGKYRPTVGYNTDSRKMKKVWILAGTIQLYGKQFDHNVLLKFLKKISTGDNVDIIKYVQSYLQEYRQEDMGVYSYGIDEYFYNMYIMPELIENKEIYCYLYTTSFAWIFYAHYYINHKYEHLEEKLKTNISRMYKYIMGKYYDTSKDLTKIYDIFDDYIYIKFDQKFIRYSTEKFKEFLFETIKEEYKLYGFDEDIIRYANMYYKTKGKITLMINNYPNKDNIIIELVDSKL